MFKIIKLKKPVTIKFQLEDYTFTKQLVKVDPETNEETKGAYLTEDSTVESSWFPEGSLIVDSKIEYSESKSKVFISSSKISYLDITNEESTDEVIGMITGSNIHIATIKFNYTARYSQLSKDFVPYVRYSDITKGVFTNLVTVYTSVLANVIFNGETRLEHIKQSNLYINGDIELSLANRVETIVFYSDPNKLEYESHLNIVEHHNTEEQRSIFNVFFNVYNAEPIYYIDKDSNKKSFSDVPMHEVEYVISNSLLTDTAKDKLRNYIKMYKEIKGIY